MKSRSQKVMVGAFSPNRRSYIDRCVQKHFPIQHPCNFDIRLFPVMSRTYMNIQDFIQEEYVEMGKAQW